MHFQTPPAEEVKIVRCTAGAVHDVIVDLRLGSPTRFRHVAVELTAANRRSLYVPQGFAHGFQTLEDRTEVFYQMNEFYSPEHASGLRFSDPKLGIKWPLEVSTMSVKDTQWPLLGD
jgi:dTDP-4-dehydrorhamnose 3,5-epimerase